MVRSVPKDLIPRFAAKITPEWAALTYNYYNAFNPMARLTARGAEDEAEWCRFAKNLHTEIMDIGYNAAVKEACKFCTQNGLQTTNGHDPFDMEDICDIIGNVVWYK